jgi:hypothetical protein
MGYRSIVGLSIGVWRPASMVAISGALASIQDWQWPIISAFLSAAAVSLIVYTQIVRPWKRRRKLKRPFDAYFLITSLGRFPLNYVQQDDREHLVKELVVPPNSEIPIQIVLEPRLSFMEREIYFGCTESLVDKGKPYAAEYFVPFLRKGVRRKPDAANPGHYTDYNGFYHVRENYLYTKDTRVIGFKLVTRETGTYPAQIYTVTDDARGRADLVIRVEPARATTKMRCYRKGHRRCFVAPARRHLPRPKIPPIPPIPPIRQHRRGPERPRHFAPSHLRFDRIFPYR